MPFVREMLHLFWNQSFWLPPTIQWENLQSNDKIQYADYRDLWYPFPMALIMLCLRFSLEKYAFTPLALSVGIIPPKVRTVVPNDVLEKSFKINKKMTHNDVLGLAKQLDVSERQVEIWMRIRRSQERPSTVAKFCESCWKTTFFLCSFIYGLISLWNKTWLWDTSHCWLNHPQGITDDIWWYYMISMSFFTSLTISQFFDVVRKDFWQMFIHHIVTIFLISYSWICNFHRIGSLIIIVHDAAEIFPDLAKAAKYAKYEKLCSFVFFIFAIVWILTRLIYFPFWILHSTLQNFTTFPGYFIFNGLLLILQVLHLYWTSLILKITYIMMSSAGQIKRDVRSSSEEESGSDTSTTSTAK